MSEQQSAVVLVIVAANDPNKAERAVAMTRRTAPEASGVGLAPYGNLAGDDAALEALCDAVDFVWANHDSQTYEEAVNAAMRTGTPFEWDAAVFLSQEALVEPGWLGEMFFHVANRSSAPRQISVGPETHVPSDVALGDVQVGIVVPVLDRTTNPSQRLNLTEGETKMGLGPYASKRLDHFRGRASVADSLDLTCVLMTRALVRALMGAAETIFADECRGVYAGRQLGMFAEGLGYRAVVAEGVFATRLDDIDLGHRTVGLADDRIAYLDRFATGKSSKGYLCLAQMAVLLRYGDVAIWRNALERHGALVDEVNVVLACNPGGMFAGYDPSEVHSRMPKDDMKMLRACSRAKTEAGVCSAVADWAQGIAGKRVFVEPMKKGVDVRAQVSKMCAQGTWVMALDTHEMVEDRVTRRHLERLMTHPDPTRRAWNFGILTHWDTPRLVRDDPPFGDGGAWTGGDHDVLMWRQDARPVLPGKRAPLFAPESIGVANVRARRFKYLQHHDRAALVKEGREVGADPGLLGAIMHEQGMRLSRYAPQNGIGMHMLAYSREAPEDIARWLDDVHGLTDAAVLVWTEDDFELPSDLVRLCQLYGARVKHHPLAENIALARNAGMDALHELAQADDLALGWALFFDPDEWLLKREEDLRMMRRMAEASESWGWQMRVANYRADGAEPTISDSVRMSRLDADSAMRMAGRVHESFDRAIHKLQAAGLKPNYLYAPFVLQHRGMAFEPERMAQKLDHYERLLRLELDEDPANPGAWVSLGWHYANDGHVDLAVECYNRGISCAGQSYLPYKELGYVRLREARDAFEASLERLVPAHPFHDLCARLVRFLRESAPPHPVVARGEAHAPAALPAPPPAAG